MARFKSIDKITMDLKQEYINMAMGHDAPDELAYDNSNKSQSEMCTLRSQTMEWYVKDIAREYLWEEIMKRHDEWNIHIHDLWFFFNVVNCLLLNVDDCLTNWTVLNNTLIEPPKSLQTAANVTSQLIYWCCAQVYGGKTIRLKHLAKYVDVSRQKLLNKYQDTELVESLLCDEIKSAIQTIIYQAQTLVSWADGQSYFWTIFLEPNWDKDNMRLIKSYLTQHIKGMKDKDGNKKICPFPKLVILVNDYFRNDESLKRLAFEATSKTMYPDIISEKNMLKEHNWVVPPMGCRSFLPDWYDKDGNIQYDARFNKGVQTLNIPQYALKAEWNIDKFWDLLEEWAKKIREVGMKRIEIAKNVKAKQYPLLFQHGVLSRKQPDDTIFDLLIDGYSSISFWYLGLDDTCKILFGSPITENQEFALKIVEWVKNKCEEWNNEDTNILWHHFGRSPYATPSENLCYRFAKLDGYPLGRKRYGNSFHIDPRQEIDAFSKISFEKPFQELSTGWFISFVELPHMDHNIEAIEALYNYIDDNCIYWELNLRIDRCLSCWYEGEIGLKMDENTSKLERICPKCSEKNRDKLSVARRTCGYIGTNWWNEWKTEEIAQRKLHL